MCAHVLRQTRYKETRRSKVHRPTLGRSKRTDDDSRLHVQIKFYSSPLQQRKYEGEMKYHTFFYDCSINSEPDHLRLKAKQSINITTTVFVEQLAKK